MTFELGRALLMSGAVTPEALSRALSATIEPGMPLARALVGLGLISEPAIEAELARVGGPVVVDFVPRMDLLDRLPKGLAVRLAALPIDVDAPGTVVVATLDPREAHVAHEIAFHLGSPVQLVRAPYGVMREALAGYAAQVPASAPTPGGPRRRGVLYTPAWGTPVVPEALVEEANAAPVLAATPPGAGSVTTSTRRFFTGMHAEPVEAPPPAEPRPRQEGVQVYEPVFELRRGPNMTLRDIDPPTLRLRDAPAFPLMAKLPEAMPQMHLDAGAPPYPDPAATLADLRAAEDRDTLLALVERSARTVAKRVGLFVVKKDVIQGWSCVPEFGDADKLRNVKIPIKSPGLLGSVLEGGVYLGPLLGSIGSAFLEVMRSATRDVAMVAVKVKERPALLVVCDELGDTLLGTRHLDVMANIAGEALERVLRARQKSA